MMSKYGKCKKCGAEAVHLATSVGVNFGGDWDDAEGNESEYGDVTMATDVIIGAHICFNCGELENIFIEYPREKVLHLPVIAGASTDAETPRG